MPPSRVGSRSMVAPRRFIKSAAVRDCVVAEFHTRARLAMATDMTTALREANERLQREFGERKRSEVALKDSEILYHSLVESLPLQILRKDLQAGLPLPINASAPRVGKPAMEILARRHPICMRRRWPHSNAKTDAQVLSRQHARNDRRASHR